MNNKQRKSILNHIDNHTDYNVSTVRISSDGEVTAILDADKTFNGPHATRILIGYVDNMLIEINRRHCYNGNKT